MKKTALILAASAMIISLSACGKTEAPSTNAGQSDAPVAPAAPAATSDTDNGVNEEAEDNNDTVQLSYPVGSGETLSFWLPIQPPAAKYISSYEEQEIFQEISKATGINIEFIHPAVSQEKEQLGLLMASGDLPDIIQIRGFYSGGSSAGVDDGVFLDLTELMPIHAPDYFKNITASEEAYRLATNNDGKITEFVILKQDAPAFVRVNFITEIMDRYGIEDMPVTISDYEELFAEMAADGLPAFAPEENGRVEQFMFPYGITNGFFLDKAGDVQFGPATENYREYLTLMNDWYNKGYLYKDFMGNLSDSERRALFSNMQVGMFIYPVDLALSQAKSVDMTIMPANYPRLNEGQEMPFFSLSFETMPRPGEMVTVVTSESKNPELALNYINYFYTQEGADLCNWGIKDKSYVEDANGNKTFTDYMLNNPEIALADAQTMLKIHLCAKLSEPDVVCNPNVISNEESLALRNMYSDDKSVNNSQSLPSFQLSAEGALKRSSIMNDIDTYINESTLKFITGATPLSEFDKYLDTLQSMDIAQVLEITQNEYNNFMTKPLPGF